MAKSVPVVYPEVGVADWVKDHDLSLAPHACSNCGVMQFPTIPFMCGDWVGVQAPLHDCGPNFQLMRARNLNPEDAASWRKLWATFAR